jgi:hypothetical protein
MARIQPQITNGKAKVVTLDSALINKNIDKWTELWGREIESQ